MTRFAVEFEWQVVGTVTTDDRGSLVFPTPPSAPGLYRLWIEGSDERPSVYIGEASDLRRRMQHYRTPGLSQITNVRLNELLRGAIKVGTKVTLSIVTEVRWALDAAEPQVLGLDRRNARLIGEQAAIAAAVVENVADGEGAPTFPRVLNRPGVGESEYE